MKVIWKGPMREENVFRYGDIPEDAQKLFPERGGWAMYLLILPIFLLAYMGIRIRLSYAAGMIFSKGELLAGVLLSVLFLSVHELIHAVCCPRGSVCFLYVTPVGLCIIPANPLGKYRYIFMAVMPTVVLGIVPFLVWLFFPDINVAAGSVLFGFSIGSLSMSIGDIYNILLSGCKMKRQSVLVTSGKDCYYFEDHNMSASGNKERG